MVTPLLWMFLGGKRELVGARPLHLAAASLHKREFVSIKVSEFHLQFHERFLLLVSMLMYHKVTEQQIPMTAATILYKYVFT